MAEREVETSQVISASPPNPIQISDSGKSPAPESNPSTEEEESEPETETRRRSKRRKNCPAALQKLEESEPLIRGFSFSFDTKIKPGRTPESTPKFGSFNYAGDSAKTATSAAAVVAEGDQDAAESDGGGGGGEEEERREGGGEGEVGSVGV